MAQFVFQPNHLLLLYHTKLSIYYNILFLKEVSMWYYYDHA